MQEDDFSSKTWVWVRDKSKVFVKGYVVGQLDNNESRIKLVDENTLLDTEEIVVSNDVIESCNPSKFNKCDDMAELTYLNEPSLLHNLHLRYNDDLIYTYSGLFLVAINPYNTLPIYNDHHIKQYHGGSKLDEMKPHIFAITEKTYQNLLTNSKDQSILVTGESGAGKTENTKKIIQYLSSITTAHSDSNAASIDTKILQANPILEAFGNAQTVKNNNSSRFGKFIKIDVSSKGMIMGANIEYYLLEKSRVVTQSSDERNYHIFYQLLKGGNEILKEFHIVNDYARYNYLKDSNSEIPKVDDAKEFKFLLNAFNVIGFSEADRNSIFKMLAVILHLGNLDFTSWKSEQAHFTRDSPIGIISSLLGIEEGKLTENFLRPKVKAGREFISKSKKPHEAKYAIDAISKHLYEKTFEFIIKQINRNLEFDGESSSGYMDPTNFIGVLDIAGFEIFKKNSFEQLCINYTNEKLQQFFNHHSFILEQKEYLKENIQWEYIDFGHDLQPTIELIENKKPVGILSILDEECIIPQASDSSFLDKLNNNWNGQSSKYSQNKNKSGFMIHHYAGKVEYNAEDWLQKNRDPVSAPIIELLANSTDSFIKEQFKDDPNLEDTSNTKGKKLSSRTASQKHKIQLTSLMDELAGTEPHFVRCILPNQMKKPKQFEKQLVLEQLRCNGVLEGVRIARAGYPNRIPFDEFFNRYSLLYKNNSFGKNFKSNCELILKHIDLDRDVYKIGLTKIFFKNGVLADLETARDARLSSIFSNLQSIVKGKLTRRVMKDKIAKIQAAQVIAQNFIALSESRHNNPWMNLFIKVKPLLEDTAKLNETKAINDQLKSLETELKELMESKKGLDHKNGNLAQEIKKLEDTLMTERSLLTEKDEQLTATKKHEIDLTSKLESTTQSLNSLSEECERMKEQRINVEKDMSSFQDQLKGQTELADDLAKNKDILEAKLSKLTKELEDMEMLKNEKELVVHSLETELKLIKTTLRSKEEQIKELQLRLANSSKDLESKLSKANEGYNLANKKLKDLMAENKEWQRKMKDTESSKMEFQRVAISKEAELSSLQQEVKTQKAAIKKISSEKSQIINDHSSHEKGLIDAREQLDSFKKQYKQLEYRAKEANDLLNNKIQDEIKFNSGRKKFEEDLAILQDKVNSLTFELTDSKSANATLTSEIQSLKNAQELIQKQKKSSDVKVAELLLQLTSLKQSSPGSRSVVGSPVSSDNQAFVDDFANIKLQLNEQSAVLRKEKIENKKLNEEMYLLKTRLASEAYENRKLKHELNISKRSTIGDFSEYSHDSRSLISGVSSFADISSLRNTFNHGESTGDLLQAMERLKGQLEAEQKNTRRSETLTYQLQAEVRELRAKSDIHKDSATHSDYQRLYQEAQYRIAELESHITSSKFSDSDDGSISPILKENINPTNFNHSSFASKDLVKIYQDVTKTLKATREELSGSKNEVLRLKNLLRRAEDKQYELERGSVRQSRESFFPEEVSQLRLKLEAVESKNLDLSNSLTLYRNRAEDYYGKLEKAEVAVKSAKRNEESAVSEFSDAMNSLKLAKTETKASEVAIKLLNARIRSAEEQVNDKGFEINKLQDQISSLEEQIDYYRRKSLSGNEEKYAQEIKTLSRELNAKLQSETELIKENKKLELDLEDARREKHYADLDLEQLEKEKSRLETLAGNLANRNNTLEKEKISNERSLEKYADQVKLLTDTMDKMRDEKDSLLVTKRQLEGRLEQLSLELDNHRTSLSQTEVDLSLLRDHLEKEREESENMKGELNRSQSSSTSYASELQRAKNEMILAQEESMAIKRVNNQLNEKITSLETRVYENKEAEYWETKVRELENKLEDSNNKMYESEKKYSTTERSLRELTIKLTNEERLVKKYSDESFMLSNKYNKMKSSYEIMEHQASETELEGRRQEREMREQREYSLRLEKEVLEWKNRFESLYTRKANLDTDPVFI